jgi:hypothetical protein
VRKIVAVGHHKEVGKDTFVRLCINFLRPELRGKRLVRRGFADKVYHFCHAVYGWAGFRDIAFYQDNPKAKSEVLIPLGKTVREVLIDVGQHMRKYDDSIWLHANLKTPDFDVLFINDIRFPTEFSGCLAHEAVMVKLTRPNLPVPKDEADTALDHYPDSAWHKVYQNNGDLNDLSQHAEAFCKEYILC